ncbi:LOW QUALITY PROTEIN: protocadherin Fat 2 [Colossoma macropomum]|uniref:LOW QUALITY PROTEIN: protocadherin Fat 2 n=1 Tax=Colossoma macropomum TaxID=42526 RepID=UPI001864E8F7|nr:LOW QUALITY PROTEIN: protocadherin Fat 2 [Colossoma macropomum]
MRVRGEPIRMALTGRAKLLSVIAVLLHIARCQGSLEKDGSPLRFTHHLYNATINENSAPRTYVESPVRMGIVVSDSFWDIKYRVVAGDDDGLFKAEEVAVGDFCFLRITTGSGNSLSPVLLNREVRDAYTLTVEATESTYEYQARTKVSIQVLDTNDLKPLFYPASYNVVIREDTPVKSSVVRVSATDADIGSNAEFYYSFTTRSHPFAVDPFTGTITLVKRLNATQKERYDLTILAEDRTKKISGVQKFGNVATVVVNVEKVAENFTLIAPITAEAPQTDTDRISVNVKIEPQAKAGVVSLSVVAGDAVKGFEIIPSALQGNDFQVVSTKRINWPQNPFGLNISLQAKDRSNPPLPTQVKNIHIPSPQFTSLTFERKIYYATLSEFSPPKTHVLKVSVHPGLPNVTYHIRGNADSHKFKISTKTGIIVTSESLDFEKKSHYEFDVTVNHGEAEAHVIVDVTDENDNAPRFINPSHQATLPENIPIGTSILSILAIDVDKDNNGFVTYAIANTAPLPFVIDPLTGVISTSEEFDYELMKRWYHLRIWASDSGSPFSRVSECAITITMTNINDNVPLFERVACNATIPLGFAAGETIVEMSAVDLDELEQIRYGIQSGNEDKLFAIDPVSGIITLAQPIPTDFLETESPSYTLKITATDGKYSADPTTVTVYVTDEGKEATTHCQETGVFRQLTEKLIESIKPVLSAQEEESFSDVHIINRHSPKFALGIPSSIDVREDFALNTSILHFQATDNDSGFNGKLVYAISSGNEDGCFSIDMNTGDLKIVCTLDRETKEFYILNVTVYDLGAPQISAWKFLAVNILDVNDNPPLFSQPRYVLNIPENTETDKSIFKVHAVDFDLDDNGVIKYSLLTFTDLFKVDETSGDVRVIGHLDRETFPRYDLKIEARDQAKEDPQLISTADLVVVLEDINDNPPKFVPKVYSIKVPEDAPPGTVLLWVESYDLDLGSGGVISYNLKNSEAGTFFLDTSTGLLTLEKELDFERKQLYNLTVRAVDHGNPRSLSSSCFVEVQVLDVNENLNKPVFSSFVHSAPVLEDAKIGTSVLTLTAVDKDLGRDGVVRYHIHDGTGLGVFVIDEETGVIRTADTLDREAVLHYWLTVYATDLGTIPLVSWTEVYIEVLDINDNPPELSQPIYFASVHENLPKDKSVLKVAATDVDKSSEGKVTFQILDSQRTYFTIDSKTGVISTVAELDREQKPEHIIEVIASDNGAPPLRSTATVVIKVLDENDNSPQFSHKLFQVKLPERQSTALPQQVYRMVARDDDEGPNGMITYSLENSMEGQFDIDPTTGVVTARGEFGRGNYSILTIKATDHGSPARMSKSRLDVEWLPQPEPSSVPLAFDEAHFTFAVMETDPVADIVGLISTEITPSPLWFDIVGGDEDQDFYIEKNMGSIAIARHLDAARRSNYNLTISVTDGSQTITTQAYIRVLDMNEHRPMFLKNQYEVRVPEDTDPWKEILQISAQDADANSRLVYSIHSSLRPDSLKHFHLDPKTGVLVLTEELDYETISTHTLIVMVRDQEIPVKRNFVKAVVHVEDCNDYTPTFMSTHYEGSISNLAPTGTEVLRVKALDKDTGSNSEIVYSIHSAGNMDGAFDVDQDTGSIRVMKSLDRLSQEQYHLTVKATDQGFPQRSDLCPVNIHVKLSELTAPKFTQDEYFTEISEASPLGAPVLSVSASCPSPVNYRIKDGDPNGTFHINSNSGLLSVQKALNFEECLSYRLQIRATNTAGVSSDAVVYVYVIDENDNAPGFLQDSYYGQISESAPMNSMVMGENNTPLVIKASDADKDLNALLIFQIQEPEAKKMFKIDPSMGTISLISVLDFETTPEFVFRVQVQDSGEPFLSSAKPCKVTIRVLDFNDCSPKFTLPVFTASITTPVFKDMKVVQVLAHDADSSVLYSIAESNHQNVFNIDQLTGEISVSDVSDLQSYYELKVEASDGLYKDTALVKVNVTKVKTTSLKFEERMYIGTVLENTTSVKTLTVLRATGSYLNEPLIYTVLNPGGKFSVVQSSGVLQTTGVPFDREEQDEYNVAVEVRDMRTPPRIAVTYVKVFVDDINDNAPIISNLPHTLMISEETEPGDVLFQVLATDDDTGENGSIIYTLEDHFNLFRIDPYLGDVSLQRPLDFESLNKYVLTVRASDEGEPSLSDFGELYIQVQNRSHPIFQSLFYPLRLPENIAPSTTILHVQARNPEGYRLIYNLVEDNASNFFHIDFKTGMLSVTDFLDYETQAKHLLTVRATDSVTGSFTEAKVEIDVEDVNDNAPVFGNLTYTAELLEGLPVGTSVIQVSAFDRDSGRNKDVTYQIVDTGKNETEFFKMDPLSGLLVTLQVLDYETIQQFHLKIKVTDNGTQPLSGEAYVIVNITDVNDNPPDFSESHYRASLDEMASCGHIVIKIQASDPDSKDSLQYKILSGNEGRYFAINESSGLISFSNVCKRNLDPFYNLTVAVSDGVFQKTAPVNIDMTSSNRHSPYFNQDIYEAELAENAESGTRVIRLAAIDPDDGPYGSVDYTIINKLADEKFSIDSEGQIVTAQPLDRENPSQRVIAIKVMAKDGGGRVAFCTVKIILTDENDNAPQFKASQYHVSIQSTINKGSPVIQIMAYDADDGKNADVTYAVDEAEEVTEEVIEINPFTGVVSVKESLVGMENKIFNFKVQARDGGIPFYNSTVPVQVKVVPPEVPLPRFTEPLYTFSASEDLPIGYEIGTVKADADVPLIYSLVDGNTVESNRDKVFAVDEESGTLVVQKNIDYEKTKWYQIDVLAQGSHNGTDVASLVSVSIQVQDVNDNQPMFEADPYKAVLVENMPSGTTVIQVTANDPDKDANGQVTYTLEPEMDDVSDILTIDSETGWITTLKEMDCETKQLYRFYVVATDHGGSVKLSSSALVEVTVTDENDNPPQFTEELYQGSIIENSRPGEVIVTLTTIDNDVSVDNRQVACYITDGDPLGQFSVIAVGEEWRITAKGSLDREVKDKHILKILATDGKFQTAATVEVHVLDINDNSPLCEQLLYTEAVMENSASGRFILKVSASDPDIGTNGQVSFTLHGPNADKFHLDPKTGELFTLAVLDREKETEYDLVVKATDGGGRSCQADIMLMVQDMNDNAPQFSTNHYEVTVFDNTTVRTPIAVIYAKDPDTGINSEVRYSLQGAYSGFFSLDEISGILRLERSLADELAQSTFELRVKATDRGLPHHHSSIATVTVHVVDLSDYQPVFLSAEYTAQLPESSAIGTEVLSVSALTRDGTGNEPVRYSIISGNEDGRFQINPETGVLWVSAALDFELCREYYLSVEGARGKASLADIAMVIINITDINDNPPVFSRGDYSAEITEDISPGDTVMQVTAVDLDGPPNNLIHYSIVSGNPQQQFSIDPRTGHIKVRSALDREEITHYSLTIQAADEGQPPLSSAVQVTVTVTDVNDNPPVFSQTTHSLVLQEGDAVGSSILQLLVSDRDTPQNGPPFSYHIVSGNEGRHFHVDQGGLLSLSSSLGKRGKPQHVLKIQVTDSGHPPLSSICVVKINVTEESKYPPTVAPLEVFITTTEETFPRRVIGKLHASDQDPQDVLSYRMESTHEGLFSVDPVDGKIVAEEALRAGLYSLNVSVSDGKFSVFAGVRVHVWAASQQALDQGFTLQLAGVSAEEFVADHWRSLQRSLGAELNIPRQELHIASLQQDPDSVNLQVLLVRRAQDGSARPVGAQRLDVALTTVGDTLGLRVLRVRSDGCVGDDCPERSCRSSVLMNEERVSHYSTARTSFITPRHKWESVCSCNESAVRFDGHGYLKYLYRVEEEKQNFHLSLRIKTSDAEGTVMTANTSDWGTLQVVEREVLFRYGCGNVLPGSLHVRGHRVADGHWHHVSLEVNGTVLRLTVDGTHSNSVVLPEPCRLTQTRGALLLASPNPSAEAHAPGFKGCLDNVEFNGRSLRREEGLTRLGSQRNRLFGVYQCCRVDGCTSNPCENGGTCEENFNGELSCSCPLRFFGARCELDNNPCASQPCSPGSLCVPKLQGYMCYCPEQTAGNRCQTLIDACSPNPCPSGFGCKMAEGSIHCDPLPQVSGVIGYIEIAEICAGVMGLLFLVAAFVCIRKRYISHKKHKSGCVQDSNGYFPTGLTKSMMRDGGDTPPMEMSTLIGTGNNLDHSPFRSLKPRDQRELAQSSSRTQKAQGPVVCSVAPNLPPPPSSSSDNDSIVKNNWEASYEVYPADPDYFGRPNVQEFPQFDIVESTYPTMSSTDSRRNSRFGGFPFPLDRNDRRAPLPPCYSNQNLDDFLGPDGLPLPSSQCPNEYTAISYYPTHHTRSMDNVSAGYKRLSVRLSVAQPSYADCGSSSHTSPSRRPRSRADSDMMESDYGSCEEVMF